MATVGRMATVTEAHVLTLAQWFSPAYPVGGFAYSHGLEAAIASGRIDTAAALKDWVFTVLESGSGRNDALFLAAAYQATTPEEITQIDDQCRAFASSFERAKETTLLGQAFAKVSNAVWDSGLDSLSFPVAVGVAASRSGLPLRLTTQMFLQAFVSNLASVGMRLIPLGQTEGQRLIRDAASICAQVAAETETGDLELLSASAFVADIDAMSHETQYSRIFRT